MTGKVNIYTAALNDETSDKDLYGFADFHVKPISYKENEIYGVQTTEFSCYKRKINYGKDLDTILDFNNDKDSVNIFAANDNETNSGIEQKYNTKALGKATLKKNNSLKRENPDDNIITNHATVCPYQIAPKIATQSESSSGQKRFNESKEFLSEIFDSKQVNSLNNKQVCTSLLDGEKLGIVKINSNSTIYRERAKMGKGEIQSLNRELFLKDKIGDKNLGLKETRLLVEEKVESKLILEGKENTFVKDTNILQRGLDVSLTTSSKNRDESTALRNIEKLKRQSIRISEKWKISTVLPKSSNDATTEKTFFTIFTGILFNIKDTNIKTMEDMRDAVLHNYSTSHEERNSILTCRTFDFLTSRLVENRLIYPTEDGYRVIGSRRPKPNRNKYLCFGYHQLGFDENNNSEKSQKGKNSNNKSAKTELKRKNVRSEGKSTRPKRKRRNLLAGYILMQVVVKLSKTVTML